MWPPVVKGETDLIFDAHAYCFPPLGGDGGFADAEEFRRHLQFATAHHPQPAWRVIDRKPGDSNALFRSENWPSLDSLKDAGFHAAGHGRFEWKDGDDTYFKQWLPPSVNDMSYPADRLVAEMDYANVDMALLHRTPYLGMGNEFLAECVRQYPDRLRALAHAPEWLVPADPLTEASRIISAVNDHGMSGIQFLAAANGPLQRRGHVGQGRISPILGRVGRRWRTDFFLVKKSRRAPLVDSYMAEHATLRRWLKRYSSNATVVLTHGLFWGAWSHPDSIQVPEELWATFEGNDMGFQIMFPIGLGAIYDYPIPQSHAVLEDLRRTSRNRTLDVGHRYADGYAAFVLPAEHLTHKGLLRLPEPERHGDAVRRHGPKIPGTEIALVWPPGRLIVIPCKQESSSLNLAQTPTQTRCAGGPCSPKRSVTISS